MLTLLIAANHKDNDHLCKSYIISIEGSGEKYAIDKTDVIQLLETAAKGKLIDKPVSAFNLSELEKALKTNLWIRSADVYFDSQDVMHVLVTEKEPVARVFTTSGNSFYIDSSGVQMPLLQKASIRLPVFTNYPAVKGSKSNDSALVADVKNIAQFINKDSFWRAQIAQVDIKDSKTFEAVPTVGNHIIRIGTAQNLPAKFRRLFVFYQQVLSKTGFDKYSVLDIQFDDQVVATHKGSGLSVDSVQLQQNIQELLKKNTLQLQAQEAQADMVSTSARAVPDSVSKKTEVIMKPLKTAEKKPAVIVKKANRPAIVKTKISVRKARPKVAPARKKAVIKKVNNSSKRPKAVMSKKRM